MKVVFITLMLLGSYSVFAVSEIAQCQVDIRINNQFKRLYTFNVIDKFYPQGIDYRNEDISVDFLPNRDRNLNVLIRYGEYQENGLRPEVLNVDLPLARFTTIGVTANVSTRDLNKKFDVTCSRIIRR